MLTEEGNDHYSNSFVSQLQYYLLLIDPQVDLAVHLTLHMDSYGIKTENDIMLGYMLRVLH